MVENLLSRLRGEFLEMPGLRLESEQVQRLCGVDRTICQRVLDSLVDENFLSVKADGAYARATDGPDDPHPQPAKADFRTEGVQNDGACAFDPIGSSPSSGTSPSP